VRSVKRFTNEEGMFERLRMDLQRIGQDYGVDEEIVNETFFQVSCNKSKLIEVLKGQNFTKWNELEDMALTMDPNSVQYKYLLKVKGTDEIIRRKKFLAL
jgi:hypothetical protein